MSDILKYKTRDDRRSFARSVNHEGKDQFEDTLDTLWDAIFTEKNITFFVENRQVLDEVYRIAHAGDTARSLGPFGPACEGVRLPRAFFYKNREKGRIVENRRPAALQEKPGLARTRTQRQYAAICGNPGTTFTRHRPHHLSISNRF